MQYLSSIDSPFLTITCCVHGDEVFGKRVFDTFAGAQAQYAGMELIFANEEAYAAGKRFVDADLNRVFPGSSSGNLEERLAYQITPLVQRSRFVLDIHTTTSDVDFVPIVTNMHDDTRKIVSLCGAEYVAYIQPGMSEHSLIGQVNAGVSLEFNEVFAQGDVALEIVKRVVHGLYADTRPEPRALNVLYVDGVIPKTTTLAQPLRNFQRDDALGVLPVLVGERAYTELHALSASKMEKMLI